MKSRQSMSTMTRVFAFLFAFVIAIIVIWNLNSDSSVVNLFNNEATTENADSSAQLYVGKQVSYTGKIARQTMSFDFTHELTLADGTLVGLKSSTINLDRFTGVVEVNGSISAMKNAMIIISVAGAQTIKVVEEVSTGTIDTLSDTNKKIFFPKIGIYASVSSPDMYTVLEKEGKIVVTNVLSGKDVMSVSHFVCQKADSTKDCAKIIKDMSPDGTPSFVSPQGNKYYRVLESTSTRFTTVDNVIGYYLTIPDEDMFKEFIPQLSFLDSAYIQRFLLKDVDKVCSTSTNSLVQVASTTLSLSNGVLRVVVKGQNDIGSGTTCMLDLQSSNNEPKLMLTALSVEGQSVKQPTSTGSSTTSTTTNTSTGSTTTASSTTETTEVKPSTESTVAPSVSTDTGKNMVYKTSRGYTITFPSRAIYYEMETTDTDLGVPGLFCNVKINVGHYKDADVEGVEPAVEIYECRTKLDPESIADDLVYKQSLDGKKLFIKVNNATRRSFAETIIVE